MKPHVENPLCEFKSNFPFTEESSCSTVELLIRRTFPPSPARVVMILLGTCRRRRRRRLLEDSSAVESVILSASIIPLEIFFRQQHMWVWNGRRRCGVEQKEVTL